MHNDSSPERFALHSRSQAVSESKVWKTESLRDYLKIMAEARTRFSNVGTQMKGNNLSERVAERRKDIKLVTKCLQTQQRMSAFPLRKPSSGRRRSYSSSSDD